MTVLILMIFIAPQTIKSDTQPLYRRVKEKGTLPRPYAPSNVYPLSVKGIENPTLFQSIKMEAQFCERKQIYSTICGLPNQLCRHSFKLEIAFNLSDYALERYLRQKNLDKVQFWSLKGRRSFCKILKKVVLKELNLFRQLRPFV